MSVTCKLAVAVLPLVLDRNRRYLDWYAKYPGSGDRADRAVSAGATSK